MKRVILIAGGTVGGLGAVLSVTPPQLSDNGLSTLAGASAATSVPAASVAPATTAAVTTTATPAAKPTTTQSAAAVATKKATTSTKKSATTSSTPTVAATSATPTPVATSSATKATTSGVSGTFTGDGINVGYGTVQVKITVSNGKITEAVAVQAPCGRNQRFTDYAIPNLRSQTLSAQSAAINGVSGASYTSYGWYKSLITALQKAGMSTGV